MRILFSLPVSLALFFDFIFVEAAPKSVSASLQSVSQSVSRSSPLLREAAGNKIEAPVAMPAGPTRLPVDGAA